ncbi:MAG: hypothetical protein VKJ64_05305 [Leptolyngbyaceae bacterium]|nr:hypothetical protein [Leptolyngbyaceae bacterium]
MGDRRSFESKHSDFAVNRAIAQALAYMLGNPEASPPVFGLICNGTDFLFMKSQPIASPE